MNEHAEKDLREAILNALQENTEGFQKWDDITTAIMSEIQKNSHYVCKAYLIRCDRDDYNYHREREIDSELLRAETPEQLYEEIARYRIAGERKYDCGDYDLTRFERIRHCLGHVGWDGCDEMEPTDEKIKSTPAWKAHEEKLEAEKQEAQRKAAAAAKVASDKKEAAERKLLADLKAKYEGD